MHRLDVVCRFNCVWLSDVNSVCVWMCLVRDCVWIGWHEYMWGLVCVYECVCVDRLARVGAVCACVKVLVCCMCSVCLVEAVCVCVCEEGCVCVRS